MTSSKLQHPDSCRNHKKATLNPDYSNWKNQSAERAVPCKDVNTISTFGNSYNPPYQNLGEGYHRLLGYLFRSYMFLEMGYLSSRISSLIQFAILRYLQSLITCVKQKKGLFKSGIEMDVMTASFCLLPHLWLQLREKYFIKSSNCSLNFNQGHSYMQ